MLCANGIGATERVDFDYECTPLVMKWLLNVENINKEICLRWKINHSGEVFEILWSCV